MAQGRIEATITAKDVASGVFANFKTNIIALNQALELAGKAMGVLSATIGSVISEGRKFTAQMSAVRAISKTTAEEFAKLTEEAKRIGETTAFTAVQAGEAMEELRRAGLNVNQTLSTTAQAMDLAAATGADLATAARVVAVNMKVFAKENLKAQKAVDLMVQTVGASPQNFENLTFALEASGGTAAAVGIDFTTLTQIFGAMANAGIKGEKAGTALNGALARLLNPTSEVLKVLTKYNIAVDKINPANQKFADILDVLKDAQISQGDLLKLLGQEAGPKFFDVISKGGDALRNFAKAQQSANSASEAASQRLDNLEGDITVFNSALSGLKLSIFDNMNDILRSIVVSVTGMVNSFSEFTKRHSGTITTIFESIVSALESANDAIIIIIRSFGSFLRAVSALLKTQILLDILDAIEVSITKVVDVFKVLVNTTKEIIDRFLEIVGANTELQTTFGKIEDIVSKTIGTFSKLSPLFSTTLNIILKLIKLGIEKFIEISDKWNDIIKNVFDSLVNLTKNAIEPFIDTFSNGLKKVVDVGIKPFAKSLGVMSKFIDFANEKAKAFDETLTGNTLSISLSEVAEEMDKTGRKLENFGKETTKANKQAKDLDKTLAGIEGKSIQIEGGIQTAGGGMFGDISKLVGEIKSIAFGGVGKAIGKNILGTIGGLFSSLIGSVSSLFRGNEEFADELSNITGEIQKVFDPIAKAFVPVLKQITKSIAKFGPFLAQIAKDLTPVIEQLTILIGQMFEALQPIIEKFISELVPIIAQLVDQIGPILVEIMETLGPLISEILDILGPIIRELIPILREILPIIKELVPIITELFKILKIFLPLIINSLRFLTDVIKVHVGILTPILKLIVEGLSQLGSGLSNAAAIIQDAFRPLTDALDSLKAAIENIATGGGIGGGGAGGGIIGGLIGAGTGGGVIGGLIGAGGGFGFQQGSTGLTKDQLLRLPGMEAGSGLVKAHKGEKIIPNGAGTQPQMNITFNVQAIDPRSQIEEIRQLLEELSLTGRLKLA